ncbi:MAG: serine/threonine-protein phosphatase [Clostridiales bacterium]|nr:serine/threonine-protein phosphatase [Clostridiales bacterium]
MPSKFTYGCTTNIGAGRDVNEDYGAFLELSDDVLLAVVADGLGSKQNRLNIQPAVIASTEIVNTVKRLYDNAPDMFLEYPAEMLLEAMHVANRVIGTLQFANDENYGGIGVCLSACLFYGSKMCFVHCGNTRVSLLRVSGDNKASIMQITRDHTVAREKWDRGEIKTPEEYGMSGDKYRFTSGLGIVAEPEIQTFSSNCKPGDIYVLTTDGVHYAIPDTAIGDIILTAERWDYATTAIIDACLQEKIQDNITAAIVFIPGK